MTKAERLRKSLQEDIDSIILRLNRLKLGQERRVDCDAMGIINCISQLNFEKSRLEKIIISSVD
ncbi:hypothetical protein [Rhizobium sp. CECT 9324]|uniref:hypothetical protein n=1 Tax=Rhizobium sp. CECT 9324 TaxID=2845820 RepID=UPI001E3B9260|nr:hypothetical protein [Rhizobium sp. CECT 9324]CAH0343728.1 hypothetical protein RHI9324_05465 [Rhizobium sp. CECT 9324]